MQEFYYHTERLKIVIVFSMKKLWSGKLESSLGRDPEGITMHVLNKQFGGQTIQY